MLVIVPVEIIAGFIGGVCIDFGGEEAIACSSGLLDIMAEARLISDGGCGGTEAGLLMGPGEGERCCLSASPITVLTRLISVDCLGLGCGGSGLA